MGNFLGNETQKRNMCLHWCYQREKQWKKERKVPWKWTFFQYLVQAIKKKLCSLMIVVLGMVGKLTTREKKEKKNKNAGKNGNLISCLKFVDRFAYTYFSSSIYWTANNTFPAPSAQSAVKPETWLILKAEWWIDWFARRNVDGSLSQNFYYDCIKWFVRYNPMTSYNISETPLTTTSKFKILNTQK